MLLLTLQLSWFEIIILQIGALILGCTIYFVYTSRRSLDQTLRGGLPQQVRQPRKGLVARFSLKDEVLQHGTGPVIRPSDVAWPDPLAERPRNQSAAPASRHKVPDDTTLSLSALLQRIEQLEAQTGSKSAAAELQHRVEELEAELAQKDAALKLAQQQEVLALQLTERLEAVFAEFEQLQEKMAGLEKQAAHTAEQASELEDLQRAYNLLQRDLVRKQERLDSLLNENHRLQNELSAAAQHIATADQQRQQLSVRSRLMQDLHTEPPSLAENQSKLQQQLRRISELELMLEQYGSKGSR